MRVIEREIRLGPAPAGIDLLQFFAGELAARLPADEQPLRFVVTTSDAGGWSCEVDTLSGGAAESAPEVDSIFQLRRRPLEDQTRFTTVLLVPTGIGAEIGGHSGDATPVARLLAAVSDRLITHPNVVNAADINEMADNTLYVEGSVLSRMLLGTLALQPVRSNRILFLIQRHADALFVNAALNLANGARASAGIDVAAVAFIDQDFWMHSSYAGSGRAVGEIGRLAAVRDLIEEHRNRCDAVALSSVIDLPDALSDAYLQSDGSVINPFGGVEAMLTHALSLLCGLPMAHAPMEIDREAANQDPGVLDPRIASEGFSWPMSFSILKGLHRSPRIVSDPAVFAHPGVVSAAQVSCLVLPDGCLGLPTLAALYQGIPVIAVRGNANLMRNDLMRLPWRPGQLRYVDSYAEAAGVLAAMRAGIAPETLARGPGLGLPPFDGSQSG